MAFGWVKKGWDKAKGAVSSGWSMVKDPFQGQDISAYNPDKESFKYNGKGEDWFRKNAEAGRETTQADLGNYNVSRGNQTASRAQIGQQIGRLDKLSADPNASVAQQQLRAGQAQNFQQSLALSRSGGGAAQQAAAMRGAMQQQAGAAQTANLQAGMMRAQETQNWEAQRGQLMMQQRAMDLQAMGIDADTAIKQAGLELGSRQLNDQYRMGMYGLGQNASLASQRGQIAYEGMRSGNQMAAQIANAQIDAQRDGSIMGMGGAIVGAGIMGGWFSDISAKTNVVPADTAQINQPLRPSPARTNTLATPATVGSEWQQGLNIPEAPSQEQAAQSQEYMQQMNQADDLAKRQIWANAVQNMTAPKGGQNQIDPMSFVNGGSYVDSDERVKDIQRENNELRSAIAKLRAMDEVGSNMRGVEDKSAYLDQQDTRVSPVRMGLSEGMRRGVERAATAASMDKSFTPEERQRIAIATRGPNGEPSSTDDQLDYARSILNWRKAEEDARRDRIAAEAAAQRENQAEIERSGWRGQLRRDRDAVMQPVATNGYIDSDERTKTAVNEIRSALGKLQQSSSPYAQEFLDAANANMGVDFGAALDSAIAKARIDNTRSDLDQLEREATLDSGRAPAVSLAALKRGEPPPLRAGTTAVARFEDRPPSPSMGDRTGVKAALGDADLSRSKATDEFLASARDRMGGGDYEQALADAVSRHRLVGQAAQVPAIEYNYTPKAQRELGVDDQRYTGSSAQAFEQIPALAPSVKTDPSTGYKKVNTPVVTMANTAMLSDLSRMALEQEGRLRRLERKYGPLGRRGGK